VTDIRHQIAEHLRFFDELGVAGISGDAAWRKRAAAPVATPQLPLSNSQSPVAINPEPLTSPSSGVADALPEPAEDRARAGAGVSRIPDPEVIQIARSSQEALEAIRADIGPNCSRCKLHKLGRRQIVFGVGNPDADLMFVGEAPGGDEDIQGIPFVGRAGQLLTKMINAIQIERDDVYIANVIKCRPPQNRNPDPDEVETCEPFLFQQIDAIQPKVIVALGSFAAKTLLRTQDPISRLRGRVYAFRGAKLIPTFHPAFLLRSPDRKRDAWEDLKKARAILQGHDE
jgi:uracil-DNA glycosylase family 4